MIEIPDYALERLTLALEDAPHVPEGYIDRVGNGPVPGYKAIRWDVPDASVLRRRQARARLSPKQLDIVQRLAHGEPAPIKQVGGHNKQVALRGAEIRLGAVNGYHAMAIATALGLVEVKQAYVLGPAFRVPPWGTTAINNKKLTLRQQQILAAIANGYHNKDIAAKLGISIETVKSHIKNLLAILGARSRPHLAALAVRHCLVL